VALLYEQQPYPENLWDIPRLIRGVNGYAAEYKASYVLAPTALLPGFFALCQTGAHPQIYCWSIRFSTDTAISYSLYARAVDPSIATHAITALGSTAGSLNHFEADVVAAPAGLFLMQNGFFSANDDKEIFAPSWWCSQEQSCLVLVTGLVAANVACTFAWTEMAS